MRTKNKMSGFTLVELMVVVAIVAIIGSTITFGLTSMVMEKKAEQHIVGFWAELTSLRARSMKDNIEYNVFIDPSTNTFSIKSVTAAGVATAVNLTGINSNRFKLEFGRSPGVPPITNTDIIGSMNANGAPLCGDWDANDSIVFKPDEMGSINSGVLYIINTNVPEVGYAIVKQPKQHTIKLLKYGRSDQWLEM